MEFIRKKVKKAGGKRRAGRIASMCLAVLMAAGIMAVPAAVSADSTGSLSDTYVSLGADLSSGERATVLSLSRTYRGRSQKLHCDKCNESGGTSVS